MVEETKEANSSSSFSSEGVREVAGAGDDEDTNVAKSSSRFSPTNGGTGAGDSKSPKSSKGGV